MASVAGINHATLRKAGEVMNSSDMVYCIGLPRSGGQSLQTALSIALQGSVIHSPGNNLQAWEDIRAGKHVAAVEVFAPLPWLLEEHPGCMVIFNSRDIDSWHKSCESVYGKSAGWNHPIWKYRIDQFCDYYQEYVNSFEAACGECSCRELSRILRHDFTKDPSWDLLCKFLDVPIPDQPYPNRDPVKRGAPGEQWTSNPMSASHSLDEWRV